MTLHTIDDSAEDVTCPLCLDPLPVETWRGTERPRLLCCGKMVCAACSDIATQRQKDLSSQIRQEAFIAQEQLSRLQESARDLMNSCKCPMCRQDLPTDDLSRFKLVQSNAENHHGENWAWAKCKLGMYYKTGVGVAVDKKKAAEWFRKAAEQGYTNAQHEMGICHQFGHGVSVDLEKACEWYETLAGSGLALSQYQLGDILYSGHGNVPKNLPKAAHLLQQAADQGLHYAQCSLAICYEHGEGVPKSLDKAIFWYRKAAQQGNSTAMYNVAGNLLMSASMQNGGHADLVGHSTVPEALYWIRKAAACGDTDAQGMVAQMEAGMEICSNCKKRPTCGDNGTVTLQRCTRCKAIKYCGAACQKAHWKAGHKKDCIDVAKMDSQ